MIALFDSLNYALPSGKAYPIAEAFVSDRLTVDVVFRTRKLSRLRRWPLPDFFDGLETAELHSTVDSSPAAEKSLAQG